ncbi:MAG: hypothetical protein BJ554DRAFT_1855 [Olpidium bornovanus]|uniref:Uncharacterized protein n=1 Tax=Olpidium bornovanus TaxID=278681 RepID=A0A8H7ZRS1_9FUNG|nr:MAG: hypothetical protein BJ554DRAFT_1855 [Olpidium bornovanus]
MSRSPFWSQFGTGEKVRSGIHRSPQRCQRAGVARAERGSGRIKWEELRRASCGATADPRLDELGNGGDSKPGQTRPLHFLRHDHHRDGCKSFRWAIAEGVA